MASSKQIARYVRPILSDLGLEGVRIKYAPHRGEGIGGCQPVRDGSYLVTIRADLNESDVRLVLAHELRHVWQHESGRLSRDATQWDGVDVSGMAYRDMPHERDAIAYMWRWK